MSLKRLIHVINVKIKIIIIIIAILMISIGIKIIFFPAASRSHPDAKIVETRVASFQDIRETTRFIGTIRATQATVLTTKARGVLDILVAPGTRVKQGELLGKIRSRDIDTNSKLSEDSVAIAKIQYERALQLMQKGVMSKNAVEEKKALWIEAQKRLSDAHHQLEQTNIEAPFAGIVGLFKIKDGSQVQEGDALVTLYNPTSLMVEFDMPIDVVARLTDKAHVAVLGHEYELTYLQRMLDEETHMCPAYVNIDCAHCIIGTTTTVDVILAGKQSVIVIPEEAIFLRESKPYVYVVKNNQARLTPVTLGLREKEMVEITSGIAKGEPVIIRGQARLYPNASVKLAALEITERQKTS